VYGLERRLLRVPLWEYVLHSRLLVALTAPLIHFCLIPFLLLDLFVTTYQTVCFPIYGIPKVRRTEYLVFDRGRLHYLNGLKRVNCRCCSYANVSWRRPPLNETSEQETRCWRRDEDNVLR
jgi:hypothetical protein